LALVAMLKMLVLPDIGKPANPIFICCS